MYWAVELSCAECWGGIFWRRLSAAVRDGGVRIEAGVYLVRGAA